MTPKEHKKDCAFLRHYRPCDCGAESPEPQNSFLQVGKTIECGTCHPEKFGNCQELRKFYEKECDCICHEPQPKDWEEKLPDLSLKEILAQKSQEIEERLEGMKGWKNCIRHNKYQSGCAECAELLAINYTLSEALKIVKETLAPQKNEE